MKVIVGIIVTLFLAVGLWWVISLKKPTLVDVYYSPHSRHSIEVWVYGEIFAMPGDAGSGKGFVLLKAEDGRILEKAATDLVIQIDEPRWFPDRVEIPLFKDWSL